METTFNQTIAPGLISTHAYDDYSAEWLKAANQMPEVDLSPLFKQDNQRITYLSLALDQVQNLLSTPGAKYVKVRFIVVNSPYAAPYFTAALFAADSVQDGPYEGEGRLSAYYLATPHAASVASNGPSPGGAHATTRANTAVQPVMALPFDLANLWRLQWQNDATAINSALFSASTNTPLLGYNFTLQDFVETLAAPTPEGVWELRLVLGVREHFTATNLGIATNTFGLAVRLYNTQGGTLSSEPYFDFATPCPPTH